MPVQPDSPYGTYGSVPTVTPEVNSPNDYLNVQADPNAFGAQIAQAGERVGANIGKVGDEAQQYAIKSARMATEAKANDVIANQWAPQVAQLSGAYQQKQGLDAVAGLQPFQDGLRNLHAQYLEQATSPYEGELLGNYMTRHIAQEMDGAQRHQDQQMTSYEDTSHKAFVETLSGNVIANYNNPDVVDQAHQSIDGQIQKHGMDRGLSQDIIDEQKRQTWGETIKSSVSRAVANGDVPTASKLYEENKENIPGQQQLEIDRLLHTENMRQFGANAAKALMSGQPIPSAPAGTAPHVAATVVTAAQSAGVDPNHALTVARIESDMGQNVGKRGDIGQTGKGGDLNEQATNMATELKKSETVATNALGRPSQPWEQYVCYQQGAGGGPALLTADPTTKAVDALNPLYSTPKQALSAVVNNGGNASMTSAQFLDLIKNKYTTQAARAQCDIPQGSTAPIADPVAPATTTQPAPSSLADAITVPHETGGIAAQQGATPTQALLQLDKVYPDLLQKANAIPNLDQREAALTGLEQQHKIYKAASDAYATGLINTASQLAVNPKFTSMDQVPADLSSALIADHPQTLTYLEARANYNAEHAAGASTKDGREYGVGFYDLFKKIHADASDPDHISSVTQLQSHVGKDGDLTIAGYDKLSKELQGKGTPDGDAEAKMREQTFKVVKRMVSGQDELVGLKDAKGEEIFNHAMPLVYKAISDAQAKGIPFYEMYDPESKNWVGNVARGLKRSQAQQAADMINNNDGASAPRTLDTIIHEAQGTNDPAKKAALKSEALRLGFIRADMSGPSVPLAGQ